MPETDEVPDELPIKGAEPETPDKAYDFNNPSIPWKKIKRSFWRFVDAENGREESSWFSNESNQ